MHKGPVVPLLQTTSEVSVEPIYVWAFMIYED